MVSWGFIYRQGGSQLRDPRDVTNLRRIVTHVNVHLPETTFSPRLYFADVLLFFIPPQTNFEEDRSVGLSVSLSVSLSDCRSVSG